MHPGQRTRCVAGRTQLAEAQQAGLAHSTTASVASASAAPLLRLPLQEHNQPREKDFFLPVISQMPASASHGQHLMGSQEGSPLGSVVCSFLPRQ